MFVVLNLDCVYCRVLRGCGYLLRLAACVLDFVGVLLYADYVWLLGKVGVLVAGVLWICVFSWLFDSL